MRRPSGRQRRLLILSLALLAFAIAYYGGSRYQETGRQAPAIAGVAIHPPSPLPELPDDPQAPIRNETLADHWSLLMLDPRAAESRSPALLRLLRIHNRLAAAPELQQALVYLYLPRELDPTVAEAIEHMGDNVHALAGAPALVDETFQRFGVATDGGGATLYLVGPQLRLHALFTPDEDIANIAEDLTSLITPTP